ncbi:MAG: HAMP domain-containing protein [Calditrichaeota bacterium]|nr:HAMP domain-containing protein [Calditrichota bacterium]
MKRLLKPRRSIGFILLILLILQVIIVGVVVNFVVIHFIIARMEDNVRDHAIQISNLIKRSLHQSMLKNRREELALTIRGLASEKAIKGIHIYNKAGVVAFASDTSDINQQVSKKSEQCIFCHATNKAKGTIPKLNRFREIPSTTGERILGLINPIENEKTCYEADCHVHSVGEKLLGLLDVQISLAQQERNRVEARNNAMLIFVIVTIVTAGVFARIIRTQIHQPISALIKGTQQISRLNWDHKIEIQHPDEMRKLAESFNGMTEKLKKAQNELKELSEKLEDRVKEKTEELENAQRQLIMAEKLASMGKLAAVVAHEINNPLSGILTYSKLIIRKLQQKPNKDAIDESIGNLQVIRHESERCGNIVKNLLLFAKKPMGGETKEDLKQILNKSIKLVKHSFDIKGIQLNVDFTEKDTYLLCDAAAMEQMAVALLINAIEACPEKSGVVSVRLERLEEKKSIRIEVSDNGCGIEQMHLPHIFEPFYSTKSNEKSVGLGLAVVYGIVERHAGSIDVKSEEGAGTTFAVTLPINDYDRHEV